MVLKEVSETTSYSFYRANMLNKIPEIHIKSFKTVDARASGLHFTTPFWAWSWPWRWYQKLPIITFSGKQEIYYITKNQLSRHYGVLSRAQKTIFRPLFGVPWGPIRTYLQCDLTRFFTYVLLTTDINSTTWPQIQPLLRPSHGLCVACRTLPCKIEI